MQIHCSAYHFMHQTTLSAREDVKYDILKFMCTLSASGNFSCKFLCDINGKISDNNICNSFGSTLIDILCKINCFRSKFSTVPYNQLSILTFYCQFRCIYTQKEHHQKNTRLKHWNFPTNFIIISKMVSLINIIRIRKFYQNSNHDLKFIIVIFLMLTFCSHSKQYETTSSKKKVLRFRKMRFMIKCENDPSNNALFSCYQNIVQSGINFEEFVGLKDTKFDLVDLLVDLVVTNI